MSVMENHISGNLYHEPLSKSNGEKCTVFQSMALSLIVHKNTIKNCLTVSSTSILLPVSLSLCILYFPFYKDKGTQPSVHHLVYAFPIFLHFHKCCNNFQLGKSILTNKFFHSNMCFFIFLLP